MTTTQKYQRKAHPESGTFQAMLFDGTVQSASAIYQWAYGEEIDAVALGLAAEGLLFYTCSGGYQHTAEAGMMILKGQGSNHGGIMMAMCKQRFDEMCEPVKG